MLFLGDAPGVSRRQRRRALDALARLHAEEAARDAGAAARQEQYELAWRMQASVPEVSNLAEEPAEVFELYGEEARDPGTFAANCLMARRLLERGVRFVQLFHQGWDQHGGMRGGIANQCRETDQASAALVEDLARRGMLEDTLVIWGGSSAARPTVRGGSAATTAETITPAAPPAGWPAAESAQASPTGPPTSSATRWSKTRSTCTTCRP